MLNEHVILVLGCLGVAQALFLSIYLFSIKTGNRAAHIFLGIALLGLTIRIGKAVLFNYMPLGPWTRNLGISGFLLVGPALWYYGVHLFHKNNDFSTRGYLHFVPFALFVIFSSIIPNDGSAAAFIAYTSILSHLAVYLLLSWRQYVKVKGTARQSLRSWYRGILLGVSLILILYVGIFVRLVPLYLLGATAFSFLIYLFSFIFLKKHHLALDKYAQSTVDMTASRALIAQLKTLFETEAPYLETNTSLQRIAKKLDTQPRVLSQAINEIEQVNFSEYVNQYRVAHAKALLQDPKRMHDKIATIAFDCGFGNLTSFNLAFKANVNMTPSQFRKQGTTLENVQ